MISLEQVKLLESKVSMIIDHVKKANEENLNLKNSLDSYQKRIDELEVLVKQFKEEQGRIEDGILSALDKLNKFEDAVEHALSNEISGRVPAPEEALWTEAAPAPEEAPLSVLEALKEEEPDELDIF